MFFRRTCWKIEKLATALPEDERQCQYRLKMIIGGNVAKSNIITTTVVVKVAKSVVTTASRRRVWRRRPQCNDGVSPLPACETAFCRRILQRGTGRMMHSITSPNGGDAVVTFFQFHDCKRSIMA